MFPLLFNIVLRFHLKRKIWAHHRVCHVKTHKYNIIKSRVKFVENSTEEENISLKWPALKSITPSPKSLWFQEAKGPRIIDWTLGKRKKKIELYRLVNFFLILFYRDDNKSNLNGDPPWFAHIMGGFGDTLVGCRVGASFKLSTLPCLNSINLYNILQVVFRFVCGVGV